MPISTENLEGDFSSLMTASLKVVTAEDERPTRFKPEALGCYVIHRLEAILIVRPDRFVADVLSPNPDKPLLEWFARIYTR